MANKLTVQQAAEKVIYALKKAGYKRDDAVKIFNGLYHGDAWNEMDLGCAIYDAYAPIETKVIKTVSLDPHMDCKGPCSH